MTISLSLIRRGTEYSLSDGTYCYWVADDGLGMVPFQRITEASAQQHGVTDRGYRLSPRYMRLAVDVVGTSGSNLEEKLDTLLWLFAPDDQAVNLRYTRHDGSLRQLDVYLVGRADVPSPGEFGPFSRRLEMELYAPDPAVYDPAQVAVIYGVGANSTTFDVAMSVPTGVGQSTINQTRTINYAGTIDSYPVIRITGPITDAKIENLTTEEELDFTGTTITAGDYYEINLGYGQKTVVDSSGTNQIAKLTNDSDLGTWHLASKTKVPAGANDIKVTGTSGSDATEVSIRYYTRYVGVWGA